jgi:hypothetical protein
MIDPGMTACECGQLKPYPGVRQYFAPNPFDRQKTATYLSGNAG